jgi:hypothetical protein
MKIRPAKVADVPQLVALNRIAQDMHASAFPERFRRDAPDEGVAAAFRAMIGDKKGDGSLFKRLPSPLYLPTPCVGKSAIA